VLSGCTTVIGSLIVVLTLIFSAAMLFRMIINSFNFIK
jgi:flagellar biogenesis protein FliO